MTYRAEPCPCGHVACKDWHVSCVADVQGVRFTQEEAEAVAATMNRLDEMQSDKSFLVKNGMFYRPSAKGYTGARSEAGLFTPEEVAVCAVDGVTAIPAAMAEEVSPGVMYSRPEPTELSISQAAQILLDACPNPIFDGLKYHLIGEFAVPNCEVNADGDDVWTVTPVEWTMIKEILNRAFIALADGVAD